MGLRPAFFKSYFNPRSLAGATICFNIIICLGKGFQSTLPRGSDKITTVKGSFITMNFNPRSLAGATALFTRKIITRSISIHAPSRERPVLALCLAAQVLFQSTLPRGSDVCTWRTVPAWTLFQSTLPRGSDSSPKSTPTLPYTISIHAPSRERR